MQLRSLLRRDSDYVGHHATERRAPSSVTCVGCGKSEPGTEEEPITLAKCSVCEAWRCINCYTMHRAPDGYYVPPTRRAWWLGLIGRG